MTLPPREPTEQERLDQAAFEKRMDRARIEALVSANAEDLTAAEAAKPPDLLDLALLGFSLVVAGNIVWSVIVHHTGFRALFLILATLAAIVIRALDKSRPSWPKAIVGVGLGVALATALVIGAMI